MKFSVTHSSRSQLGRWSLSRWSGAVAALVLVAACRDVTHVDQPQARVIPAAPIQALLPDSGPCLSCVYGPNILSKAGTATRTFEGKFVGDPAADYMLVVKSGDPSARVEAWLNGVMVMSRGALELARGAEATQQITVRSNNVLVLRLYGMSGASATAAVMGGAKSIGPSGGTVTAPSGATLTVPANAVSTPVQIQLVSMAPPAASPGPVRFPTYGPLYDLLPSGTRFALPVTLRVPRPASAPPGDVLRVYQYRAQSDELVRIETARQSSDRTLVEADIDHFSFFIVGGLTWAAGYLFNKLVLNGYDVSGGPTQQRSMLGLPPMQSADVSADLAAAFKSWGGALGSRFTANPLGAVSIKFGQLDGYNAETAYGCIFGACTQPFVTITFNDSYEWYSLPDHEGMAQAIGRYPDLTLYKTAVHEIGHALGLDHHNPGVCNDAAKQRSDATCIQPPVMAAVASEHSAPFALWKEDLQLLQSDGGYAAVDEQRYADHLIPLSSDVTGLQPGSALTPAQLPKVRVEDPQNRPVEGVVVSFVALDGGQPTSAVAVTDGSGEAVLAGWTSGAGANATYRIAVRFYRHGPRSTTPDLTDYLIEHVYTFTTATPATGLVAHYKFDGNPDDASGNGHHATVNNATLTSGVSGHGSTAYAFNGTNAEIRIPAAPTNALAAGTISMWIRLDDTNAQYNIFAKATAPATYPLRAQYGGGPPITQWCFIVNTLPPNDCSSPDNSFTPPSTSYGFTNWHLYTFTWSPSGRTIYLDGVPAHSVSRAATTPAQGELILSPPSALGQERLKGAIDDVRIYNYELSASEVLALVTTAPGPVPPSTPTGLVAFYPLDGNGNDASGNGNHGTVTGATAAAGRTGASSGALNFSGNSMVRVPSNNILKGLTGDLTLVYWVKRGVNPIQSGMLPVARREFGNRIHFLTYSQLGGFAFQCCSSGGSAPGMWYAPAGNGLATLNDGAWHQIAVTRRFGSGGFTELYIDGLVVAGSYLSGTASDLAPIIDADLLIGQQASNPQTPPSNGQYEGLIDDVMIYNTILTPAQLRALM